MTENIYSFTRTVLRRAMLVLAVVALTQGGFAQTSSRQISGVVKDSLGPVLAATVVVDGTSIGVSTGIDGDFTINVPANAKRLVVSYVGYEDAYVDLVPSKTSYEIVLSESSTLMDDVVVVGYGVQKRSDLTGSVSSVNSKVLEAMPVSSAAEAITGRMAGVQVTTSEGGPDAEIKIRVRGGGSITQDNSPLFIVDGFPVSSINDIAPGDIQSIDVLKDASATAIYGARGANGVVIVTTKSGKEGKTTVSLNAYFGWKYLANELDVLDSYEYVTSQYELANRTATSWDNDSAFLKYYGAYGDLELYKNLSTTNWQQEIFGRTAFTQNYNASITGGTDKIKYNVGLTHMDDESIMIGSSFMRNNINAKVNAEICKGLTFDFTARYSYTTVLGAGSSTEGGSSVPRLKHAIRYMPTNGLAEMLPEGDEYIEELLATNSAEFLNPVDITNDEYKKSTRQRQTYNGALNWKIIEGLTFRSEWGADLYDEKDDTFYGLSTSTARKNNLAPVAMKQKKDSYTWRISNTLTYQKTFDQRHDLTVMVGQEVNSSVSNSLKVEARYFPKTVTRKIALANMDLGTARPISSSDGMPNNLASVFGRVNYSFDSRYMLTASIRADGSSKFAPGHQWGYFPSAAVGWRISEEQFMKGAEDWLSNLKLRFSYGASGNNRIGNDLYRYVYEVSSPSKMYGINGVEQSIMTTKGSLPNPELTWETTITRNLGVDFGFFNNRLTGSVELYWNTTKDLLIAASIPSSSGFNSQYQNIGKTANKGVEVMLDAVLVDKQNFRLNFNANLSYNKNKVEELGYAQSMLVGSGWESTISGLGDYLVQVGKPIGQVYGFRCDGFYTVDDFDYIYDPESKTATWIPKDGIESLPYGGSPIPGAMKIKNVNPDGKIDSSDREVLGCVQPTITGGFNLSAQFYGFDVAAYFNYSVGNKVYNANKIEFTSTFNTRKYGNLLGIMRNRFTYIDPETGTTLMNDIDALRAANENATIWTPTNITRGVLTDWALEDASFLRLSNLTVGYTLPQKWTKKIGMSRLRVYCTGTNLFCWTGYTGYDPEVDTRRSTPLTPNVDYSAFPRARQWVVGANITF